MGTQPSGMGGMLPGAAAGGGLGQSDDDEDRATSDGTPVGLADREADVESSGADGDDDDTFGDAGATLTDELGMEDRSSGDGVPVGADDAEADRERATDG